MFFNQPEAVELGSQLEASLGDERWASFDFAVAWVRRSGTDRLEEAARRFLARGGEIRATVGVDLQNTSQEGLSALLDWETSGKLELFVFHDEDQSSTFHPKVYLFSSDEWGHLHVGSNNLTGSGLANNTEAALSMETLRSDPALATAEQALASWRDDSSAFVRRLDAGFLSLLVRGGYVRTEQALRQRQAADLDRDSGDTATGPLFGRSASRSRKSGPYGPPHTPAARAAAAPSAVSSSAPGQTLLMRIRPARGGTQVQLPKALRGSPFFRTAGAVVSAHDGEVRSISEARARGIVNTLKFEVPEAKPMAEPLLRLRWVNGSLQYEAIEASSAVGRSIKAQLEAGFATTPPQTEATKSNHSIATWWRFV